MRLFFLIVILTGSFSSFAQSTFSCAGGREACDQARVLYRLQRLTGETCAGGYEACRQYLEDRLSDLRFEKELEEKSPKVRAKVQKNIFCMYAKAGLRCLRFKGDATNQSDWINPHNPPSNIDCYVSRDQKNASCVETL